MSLDQIAIRHNTDKSTLIHGYTPIYEKYFEPLRQKPILLMELGTGAYWKKEEGFNGAKTWADYFYQGKVVTIDICAKTPLKDPRILFFQGSQDDEQFLQNVIRETGQPDIIIDDASHISTLTIKSFEILFPLLKPGGYYVIEDTHASYWDKIASDGTDFKGGLNNPRAILNFMKTLTDSINHRHVAVADQGIRAMSFYEKIVFIEKR